MQVRKNFDVSHEPRPALYICSTPIGNLGDVSNRLIDTLRGCDIIAAEDTRQTRKLLSRFEIHPKKLVSCHEHNQAERKRSFQTWWQEGLTIALVSDAGTPLVSDPGWTMVDAAIDEGVPVVPIPGPSALLAALVGSGLPAQPFAFFGFLPRGKADASRLLQTVMTFPGTSVFYEAPHRLVRTLERLRAVDSSRRAVLAKELTKTHEAFIQGTIEELLTYCREETPRGEYVILLAPFEATESSNVDEDGADVLGRARRMVEARMRDGESHASAVRLVAEELGIKRRELYRETIVPSADEDA